jgi:thiosulfate/3-mercaptopyruvate sulfurtransferase
VNTEERRLISQVRSRKKIREMPGTLLLVPLMLVFLLLAGQARAAGDGFLLRRDQLLQMLRQKDPILVLDARSTELYRQGHIEGSLNFSADSTIRDFIGGLPSLRAVQEQFSRLGVTDDRRIVVYDHGDYRDAARIFWLLELFGFAGKVSVLEGGFGQWVLENRQVSPEQVVVKPTSVIVTIDPDRVATRLAMRLAMEDPLAQIIDVREPEQIWDGDVRYRNGYIPGAVSVPWAGFFQSTPRTELRKEEFAWLNTLFPGRRIILYCLSGKDSPLVYFAFRLAGREVTVYGGGWDEWRRDLQLPVESMSINPIRSGK